MEFDWTINKNVVVIKYHCIETCKHKAGLFVVQKDDQANDIMVTVVTKLIYFKCNFLISWLDIP